MKIKYICYNVITPIHEMTMNVGKLLDCMLNLKVGIGKWYVYS